MVLGKYDNFPPSKRQSYDENIKPSIDSSKLNYSILEENVSLASIMQKNKRIFKQISNSATNYISNYLSRSSQFKLREYNLNMQDLMLNEIMLDEKINSSLPNVSFDFVNSIKDYFQIKKRNNEDSDSDIFSLKESNSQKTIPSHYKKVNSNDIMKKRDIPLVDLLGYK